MLYNYLLKTCVREEHAAYRLVAFLLVVCCPFTCFPSVSAYTQATYNPSSLDSRHTSHRRLLDHMSRRHGHLREAPASQPSLCGESAKRIASALVHEMIPSVSIKSP